MPEDTNIYTFLKENKLTDKSESDFYSEYSSPEKAKELHGFFTENNLTSKDYDTFFSDNLKKKDSLEQLPSGGAGKSVLPSGEKGEGVNKEKHPADVSFNEKALAIRPTERANPDGSVSTHLMSTETFDGKNWFSFPTIFPKEPGKETSDPKDWIEFDEEHRKEAFEEAKKRGEVFAFGENKEAALAFGEGSWKPESKIAEQVDENQINITPTTSVNKEDIEINPTDFKLSIGSDPGSVFNISDFKREPFDPSGTSYDYETARNLDVVPDDTGNWQNSVELPDEKNAELGLPSGSGVILMGKDNPLFDKMIVEQGEAGYSVVNKDGRFFSVPKDTREAALYLGGHFFSVPTETLKTIDGYVQAFPKSFNETIAHNFDLLDNLSVDLAKSVTGMLVGDAPVNQMANLPGSRPLKAIADLFRSANIGAAPLPQNEEGEPTIGGSILTGLGGITADIGAMMLLTPEVKVGGWLSKYGIKTVDKFAIYLGAKGALEGVAKESETLGQEFTDPLVGAGEGFATGLVFASFGKVSQAIGGRLVKSLFGDVVSKGSQFTLGSTSTISNSLLFGGYAGAEEFLQTGKVSASNVATNIGIGLGLGIKGIGAIAISKSYNNVLSAPKKVIENVSKSKVTPEALVAEAETIIKKGTTGEQELKPLTDQEVEFHQKRLNLKPVVPTTITKETEGVVNDLLNNKPILNDRLNAASDNLYTEYKRITAMKQVENKQFTSEQINSAQEKVANMIELIEGLKTRQIEAGEFKTISKEDLQSATALLNLAGLKAGVKDIAENSSEHIEMIKESDLPEQAQNDLIAKVNEIAAVADPEVQKFKKVNEQIESLQKLRDEVDANENIPSTIKDVRLKKIDEQISGKKKSIQTSIEAGKDETIHGDEKRISTEIDKILSQPEVSSFDLNKIQELEGKSEKLSAKASKAFDIKDEGVGSEIDKLVKERDALYTEGQSGTELLKASERELEINKELAPLLREKQKVRNEVKEMSEEQLDKFIGEELKAKGTLKQVKSIAELETELEQMLQRKEQGSKDPGLDSQIEEWTAEIEKQKKLGVGDNTGSVGEKVEPVEPPILPKEVKTEKIEEKIEPTEKQPWEMTKAEHSKSLTKEKVEEIGEGREKEFNKILKAEEPGSAQFYRVKITDGGSEFYYLPGENKIVRLESDGNFAKDGISVSKEISSREESEIYEGVRKGRVQIERVPKQTAESAGRKREILLKPQLVTHKGEVMKALSEGKTIPEEVLKDYPDLIPDVGKKVEKPKKETKSVLEKPKEEVKPPVEKEVKSEVTPIEDTGNLVKDKKKVVTVLEELFDDVLGEEKENYEKFDAASDKEAILKDAISEKSKEELQALVEKYKGLGIEIDPETKTLKVKVGEFEGQSQFTELPTTIKEWKKITKLDTRKFPAKGRPGGGYSTGLSNYKNRDAAGDVKSKEVLETDIKASIADVEGNIKFLEKNKETAPNATAKKIADALIKHHETELFGLNKELKEVESGKYHEGIAKYEKALNETIEEANEKLKRGGIDQEFIDLQKERIIESENELKRVNPKKYGKVKSTGKSTEVIESEAKDVESSGENATTEVEVQRTENRAKGLIDFIDKKIQEQKAEIKETPEKQTGDTPGELLKQAKSIPELQQLLAEGKVEKDKAYNERMEELRGKGPVTDSQAADIIKEGRIEPSTKSQVKVKPIRNILSDLVKGLQHKIRVGPTSRGRAAGDFNPTTGLTRIKKSNDMDTAIHEVGHYLDARFKLLDRLIPSAKEELNSGQFEGGSKPPKNHPDPETYKLRERIAEWIRAYSFDPAQAIKLAPEFYKTYRENVTPEVQKTIEQFSNDVRDWWSADVFEQIGAQIKSNKEDQTFWEKATAPFRKSDMFSFNWVDRVTTDWLNQHRGIEKAFKIALDKKGIDIAKLPSSKNTIDLLKLLAGYDDTFFAIYEKGMVDSELKVLKDKAGNVKNWEWLLSPVKGVTDGKKESVKEFLNFSENVMVAKRTVELIEQKLPERQILADLKNGILPSDKVLAEHDRIMELKIDGKEVNEIISDLKEAEVEPISDERYDFTKSDVTGIGGGIKADYAIAKKAINDYTNLKYVDKGKYDAAEELGSRYKELAGDVLKYMKDGGRISDELYNGIISTNTEYVALKRIMDTEPGEKVTIFKAGNKGKIGLVSEPLHKIKGSTRTIVSPYESLLDNIYTSVKETNRNRAMLSFVDVLKPKGGEKLIDYADIGFKTKKGDVNTISVFRDGNPEHWRFDPGVFKSLKSLNETGYKVPLVFTIVPTILRASVTNAPQFALRNRIRDFQARLIFSDGKFSFRDFINKKESRRDFELAGGGQFGYHLRNKESYYGLQTKMIKQLSFEENSFVVNPKTLESLNPLRLYKKFVNQSERATRIEEYKNAFRVAKKRGDSDFDAKIYAAARARDLLDFKVIGYKMQALNQMIPFANARVQGFRKMIRSAKESPGKFTAKWITYAMIPQLMNSMIMAYFADEDKKKEYLQFPHYRRDLFFNIPIGDTWLTIPKPFELGVMASMVGRVADKWILKDKAGFEDGYIGWLIQAMSPMSSEIVTGGSDPVQGVLTNYDAFRDKNIVPPYEKDVAVTLRQHKESASRLSKLITKTPGLKKIDPRLVDFYIKSQFSYFGDIATRLSDIGAEGKRPIDISITGVFKKSGLYGEKNVQWLMDTAKENKRTFEKDYVLFQEMMGYYFDETDKDKKKIIENQIRNYVEEVRKEWEFIGLDKPENRKTELKIREFIKK